MEFALFIYGNAYDRLESRISEQKQNFVDGVRNAVRLILNSEVVKVNVVFVDSYLWSESGEHFLVEVKDLPELQEHTIMRIGGEIVRLGHGAFSYHDCYNHDSWDVTRNMICRIEQPNHKSFVFSSKDELVEKR